MYVDRFVKFIPLIEYEITAFLFFQEEDSILDRSTSRGLGDITGWSTSAVRKP